MTRPAGTPEPPTTGLVPLEHRVLVLWRVRAAIVVVTVLVPVAVVLAVVASTAGAIAGALVVAGIGGGATWWWTALVWRSWRFEVGTDALQLRHGVLTRRSSTIPYHRVQHIDLEAGPLDRRFGLTSLVLRTASASSDSRVPGIDADHAAQLRQDILDLVGTGDAT
ncbi:MAG: PH domain-containing protein [Acidimicrobiales bacterium]|nr:PH domain-containing protein [Acidimicrobiales bacterium]